MFEGTSVLNGGFTIESPSVVLDGVPPIGGDVSVLLGGTGSDVDENESLELVDVSNIQSVDHAKHHAVTG